MNKHLITNEAFDHIQESLGKGKYWLAYNTQPYHLEKGDVAMFHRKDEATLYAASNISDTDSYRVVPVATLADVLRAIPHGKEIGNDLRNQPNKINYLNQSDHSNKTTIMNENNFKYLDDQIFYKNFGRGHSEELKAKIAEGKPEFMLTHQQDYGKDNTVATLHFKKSNESDMYFFNSYNLVLKAAGEKDPVKQTFYINNDPKKREQEDVTLKEGYNLLSGRAVNKNLVSKEGSAYNAWMQLDFKTTDKHGNYEEKKFHQNYGFDLEKSLSKHSIKELGAEKSREQLVDSLKRGNRQAVTLQHSGSEQKIFIEAAPQYKGLNFFDSSMKRLNVQDLYAGKTEGKGEQKQEGKQESKPAAVKLNDVADDGGEGKPSGKNSRNRGQAIS